MCILYIYILYIYLEYNIIICCSIHMYALMYINVYNIIYIYMYENDVLPSSRIEMEHIKWNQISYIWSWVIVIVQDCGHASTESANKRDASNFEPLKSSKVHEKAGQYPFAGRITWWPTHFIDLHGSTAPLGPAQPPISVSPRCFPFPCFIAIQLCEKLLNTLPESVARHLRDSWRLHGSQDTSHRNLRSSKSAWAENMSWSPGEIHMDLEQKMIPRVPGNRTQFLWVSFGLQVYFWCFQVGCFGVKLAIRYASVVPVKP